jgi:hypothetical protein
MRKIVPDVTRPWRRRIVRRHAPPAAKGMVGFRTYRPCLRWEFGFSCAFCLCHETDLMLASEGWGVMQIEHFVPKTLEPARINDYENCFYVCRLCNGARGNSPNRDADGRSLLNPCATVWHERFKVTVDELQPRQESDGDAAYTSELYDFEDARKVRLRRARRKVVSQRLSYLRRSRDLEDDLLDRLEKGGGSELVEMVDTARAVRQARKLAFEDLLRFRAVPDDRDTACACRRPERSLPPVLDEQTIDLSVLLRPALKRT